MSLEVPEHMRLDRTMTGLIIDIDPKYGKYTDARGGVTVHLKKSTIRVRRELRSVVRESVRHHAGIGVHTEYM